MITKKIENEIKMKTGIWCADAGVQVVPGLALAYTWHHHKEKIPPWTRKKKYLCSIRPSSSFVLIWLAITLWNNKISDATNFYKSLCFLKILLFANCGLSSINIMSSAKTNVYTFLQFTKFIKIIFRMKICTCSSAGDEFIKDSYRR